MPNTRGMHTTFIPNDIWRRITLNNLYPQEVVSLSEVNRHLHSLFKMKPGLYDKLTSKNALGVLQVFVGGDNTFILTRFMDKPRLFVSGYNDYGQLGTGDNQHKDEFTLIQLPAEIKSIESVHAVSIMLLFLAITRIINP